MKQVFTKIASFLLAFLVLFSTFSFTVEKHYCGDYLVDVSFTGNAHSCGVDLDTISEIVEDDCCKEEIQNIEGQDNLRHSQIEDLDFSQQLFLATFYISYNNLFVEKTANKTRYKNLSHLDISLDYQVLYQSFLI